MSETIFFDLEEICKCCACGDDERGFAEGCFTRAQGYYRKHPPIGRGLELFFININPRSTNNPPMDWAMESLQNFQKFASNRYREKRYIPTYGERFYDIHHRICEAIFPGRAFEDTAIVHELYLCATPDASGLPGSSPCAKRYLWPHLRAACPKLVVAFGRPVAEFFDCGYRGDRVLELPNATKTRLISLSFPRRPSNAWKAGVTDWVKRCFAVGTSGPLPTRDFDDAQRRPPIGTPSPAADTTTRPSCYPTGTSGRDRDALWHDAFSPAYPPSPPKCWLHTPTRLRVRQDFSPR